MNKKISGPAVGDLAGDFARLEALLADLKLIATGQGPTEEQLAGAPLIDSWMLVSEPRPNVCLAGQVHGHPDLRGPLSVTTEVWFLAPDFGWARTRSRFYRLGRPLGAENAS